MAKSYVKLLCFTHIDIDVGEFRMSRNETNELSIVGELYSSSHIIPFREKMSDVHGSEKESKGD